MKTKTLLRPLSAGAKGFVAFARKLAEQLKSNGRMRTAETYLSAVHSLQRFLGEKEIPLTALDSGRMKLYEAYLKAHGICPNSISFYMRNLRSIYNQAVAQGLTPQRNPFKLVYTGIEKTVKRAVSLEVIRCLRDMDLSSRPSLDYARDLFMFSFYTRGMSFIDMAFLKKEALRYGVLTYRRHKTDRQLLIRWEPPMQAILDKYDTTGTPYLLPILRKQGPDARTQYQDEVHRVNRNLRQLGEQLGLPIPLTTYVARHAWASIAKEHHIPVSTISEAMGHDSETTTQIYLASLDTAEVDQANRIVLKSLG